MVPGGSRESLPKGKVRLADKPPAIVSMSALISSGDLPFVRNCVAANGSLIGGFDRRARQLDNKAAFLWQKFPKFALGFLAISLLATLGASTNPHLATLGFTKPQLLALGNLSRWAFLLTFAGVGLRTNLKDLFKQGARPFIVGAVGEVAIAAITLLLVLGADRIYHL
jgi:hypothetical protein